MKRQKHHAVNGFLYFWKPAAYNGGSTFAEQLDCSSDFAYHVLFFKDLEGRKFIRLKSLLHLR